MVPRPHNDTACGGAITPVGPVSLCRGTALLVVDVQPCYWRDVPEVHDSFPQLPNNMTRLLSAARSRGANVVHIRASYAMALSPWLEQFSKLHPERDKIEIEPMEGEPWAAPIPGEPVIVKDNFNAFLSVTGSAPGSDLASMLRCMEVNTVIVCGLITSVCVNHTAYGAMLHGFRTAIVSECCGDRGVERHRAALSLYVGYLFPNVTLDELDRAAEREADAFAVGLDRAWNNNSAASVPPEATAPVPVSVSVPISAPPRPPRYTTAVPIRSTTPRDTDFHDSLSPACHHFNAAPMSMPTAIPPYTTATANTPPPPPLPPPTSSTAPKTMPRNMTITNLSTIAASPPQAVPGAHMRQQTTLAWGVDNDSSGDDESDVFGNESDVFGTSFGTWRGASALSAAMHEMHKFERRRSREKNLNRIREYGMTPDSVLIGRSSGEDDRSRSSSSGQLARTPSSEDGMHDDDTFIVSDLE